MTPDDGFLPGELDHLAAIEAAPDDPASFRDRAGRALYEAAVCGGWDEGWNETDEYVRELYRRDVDIVVRLLKSGGAE